MPAKKGFSRAPPPSPIQDPTEGLPEKFSALSISDDKGVPVPPSFPPPPISAKPVILPPVKKANKRNEEHVIVDSWEDEVSDGSEGDVVVIGRKGWRRWDDDTADDSDDKGRGEDSDKTPTPKVRSKSFSSAALPFEPRPNTKAFSLGSPAPPPSQEGEPAPGGSRIWDSDPPSPLSGVKSFSAEGEPQKKRPPMTDVVARRMIANALGIKVPMLTAEQKEYEASMKDQLKKKRERKREEREATKKEKEEAERRRWEGWEG
ncbi:hypothetical protein EV426DRAFT_686931 [Tirmania nivea]|nr:hypothetical protein EV426DRAFT_686931 [Tirmania nivea]